MRETNDKAAVGNAEQSEPNWFYVVGGKPHGPVPECALRRAIEEGELGKSIFVFREGLQTWQRAQDCTEFVAKETWTQEGPTTCASHPKPVASSVRVRIPNNGDRVLTLEELKEEVRCKRISLSDQGLADGESEWMPLRNIPRILDVVLPPLTEAVHSNPSGHEDAPILASSPGEGAPMIQEEAPLSETGKSLSPAASPADKMLATRRSRLFAQLAELVALFFGGALLGAAGVVLGLNTTFLSIVLWLSWVGVNSVLLFRGGQTIGKMLLRVRIVDVKANSIRGARIVFLRYLPWCLLGLLSLIESLAPLCFLLFTIDFLFIFRKDRRCLHDMIAGTIVVSTNSGARERRLNDSTA